MPSRAQRLRSDGAALPPMPDMQGIEHLWRCLWDAGPLLRTAMGPQPLGWAELLQWQQATGARLCNWEQRALRAASAAYVDTLGAARDPSCPPPWLGKPSGQQRQQVAQRVRSIFGGRAAGPRTRAMGR